MKVEIYVSNYCPYCDKAKNLLKQKNVEWVEHNIQQDSNKLVEMLQRTNGRKTVPQIFINDEHTGGCDDLYALNEKGNLDKILN